MLRCPEDHTVVSLESIVPIHIEYSIHPSSIRSKQLASISSNDSLNRSISSQESLDPYVMNSVLSRGDNSANGAGTLGAFEGEIGFMSAAATAAWFFKIDEGPTAGEPGSEPDDPCASESEPRVAYCPKGVGLMVGTCWCGAVDVRPLVGWMDRVVAIVSAQAHTYLTAAEALHLRDEALACP